MTETGPEIHAIREGKCDLLYNVKLTPSADRAALMSGPTVPADCDPILGHCATIDRLPNEILEFIFIFYLDLYNQVNLRHLDYHELRNQHRLTAVSSRWRALMHSAPKLWSYIGFDFRQFSELSKNRRNGWARGVDMLLVIPKTTHSPSISPCILTALKPQSVS
jgi:hypothetical protein